MPRDISGNYSLPSGNPVIAHETIESNWANTTFPDIAQALTNSLSRNGNGGMLVPFRFVDGTVNAPGITFQNEPTSGIYRAGLNDIRLSLITQDIIKFALGGVTIPGGKTLTVSGLLTASGGVAVAGGVTADSINGTPIGNTAPSTGAFTALTSTSGALNGSIGGTTPSTGAFTNASATGSMTAPTFNGNLNGNAATATLAAGVTTNANLTGPITSVGNATSVASQTGTGSQFVMANSPTINTPIFAGTANGNISGSSASCTGNAATSSACTGNAATATSAGACTGNSATATTANNALACSGNAATATTAAACSGNAATSSSCTGNAATATTAAACSGNAASATKLQTARTINGVAFDGTANIVLPAPGFAPSFESAEQVLVIGTLTQVAHGLGRVPALARIVMRCKTAEQGYAVGDEVPFEYISMFSGSRGATLFVNAANIGFVMCNDANGLQFMTRSGTVGLSGVFTLANWRAVLRAW